MRSLVGREVIRALERAGFQVVRTSGSHHILKQAERPGTVSVPIHSGKELKAGTLRGIIRQSGLTPVEFWEFADQ